VPSKHWIQSFLKRHRAISSRVPEALTRASANVTSRDIDNFFIKVKQSLTDLNLIDLATKTEFSGRVFNIDETSLSLNCMPRKVLSKRGVRNVRVVEPAKHHQNITVTLIVSADGKLWTPQTIFDKDFSATMQSNCAFAAGKAKQDLFFAKTEKGWQDQSSFFEYLKKFDEEITKMGVVKPVLLYSDGHKSRMNLSMQEWCMDRGIILILFYPNSTHILQPLDVGFFKPFKNQWKDVLHTYKKANKLTSLSETDFITILCTVIKDMVNPQIIINAFKSSGTFPLDRTQISDEKLIGVEPVIDEEIENAPATYATEGLNETENAVDEDFWNEHLFQRSSSPLSKFLIF
jgi:hypothetical protein